MKNKRILILFLILFFSLSLTALALGAARSARAETHPAPLQPQPTAAAAQGSIQNTYVYTSSNAAPIAIPEDCLNPLEDIIFVPDTFTIQDLNVGLAISHPDRYDLSISLVSPDLQVINLLDTVIVPFTPNINVMYDEESQIAPGATPHPLPPPYYPFTWDPDDDMAVAFYGKPSYGPWKIQICDNGFNAGSGDLLKWSLWFEAIPVSEPNFDLSYFVAPAKIAFGEPIPTHIVIENFGSLPSATASMVNALPIETNFNVGSLICTSGTCTYNETLHQVLWNGSLGVGESAEISYVITPQTPGTGPFYNTATISDGVAPDVMIHTITYGAPVILEQFTFEPPDPGFYTTTLPNDWYWGDGFGDKPFHSGPTHWMTAPGGMSNYTSGRISTLYHDLDLTMYQTGASLALQWWEWYDLDMDASDLGTLQINGSTVYTVFGSSLSWTHQQIDLSPYAGQMVQLAWELNSQPDGDTGMGWHIDEVSVHTSSPGADLAVTLTDHPDPVLSNTNLTYTLQIINNGSLAANNIVITDALPTDLTYITALPNPGDCSVDGSNVVTCNIALLSPGTSTEIQLVAWVNQLFEGWLTNTVQVAADEFDPLPFNNTADETTYASISSLIADMGVTLHDTFDPIVVGSIQTYTVNASNMGFVTATSVVATVNLATGVSFSHSIPPICIQVGPDINCTFGMIPPGGNAHVDLVALVEAFVSPGILTATAEVTTTVTDPIPLNNYTIETTLAVAAPSQADLALSMVSSPTALPAGGLLTYTLSVHNIGPLTATNVVITDLLPAEANYIRSFPDASCALISNRLVTCNMGTPGPGMTKDVTLLVQVRPGTLPGLIENKAWVAGDLPDPNTGNNEAVGWTMITTGDETRPLIYGLSPQYGFNTYYTTLYLSGTNFTETTAIYLGGFPLTDTEWVDSSHMQAVVPPGFTPGTYSIKTRNPNGEYAVLLDAFSVLDNAPLTIYEVKPRVGLTDVPVVLNISGSNFSPELVGWLSDGISTQVSLQNIEFINIHQVRAMAPISMPMGIYALTLEDPMSGQIDTLENAYAAFDPTAYDDLTAFDHGLWIGPPAPVVSTTATTGLMVYRLGGTEVLTEVKVSFALDGVFLGYGYVEMPALRSRQVATLTWPVPITPGVYTLEATIDPFNAIPEADESNNLITRTIRILPETAGEAPVILSFAINENTLSTNIRQVTLDVSAIGDPAWLYYAEYVFNQSASAWMPVGQSGWLPYAEASSAYTWILEPVAGVHYIQVWAATAQGSVTPMPARRLINLMPDSTPIAQGEGHIYRAPVVAGDTYVVRLISLQGDADLYVWRPDGTEIGRRETSEPIEMIAFTASMTGIYQIEVEGHTNARYRLEVYNVSDLMPLELPAPPNTILQPDRRGRDQPLSVDPPADEIGLPRTPATLYTTLLPTIQR